MTKSMTLRILGAVSATTLVLVACSNERAITTQPIGNLGFGSAMARQTTNLPRGRVQYPATAIASATPATDSIVVTLAGMDSLSTGSYVVWVANDSATDNATVSKWLKATGNIAVTRVDSTINQLGDPVPATTTRTYAGVSSFTTGGSGTQIRFATARNAITGLAAGDTVGVVLVSIETSETATKPSDKRILWARRGDVSAGLAPMRFGNFKPTPADQFTFATSTTALTASMAILPRGRLEVRGPIFVVNDSNYYRPPVGYYYAAWAIRIDAQGRFLDTVALGEKLTPYPKRLSYYDADTSIPDPLVMYGTPFPAIVAASHRVSADTIPAAKTTNKADWYQFGLMYVTLQNKAAPRDRMGANIVMAAGIPSSVFGR